MLALLRLALAVSISSLAVGCAAEPAAPTAPDAPAAPGPSASDGRPSGDPTPATASGPGTLTTVPCRYLVPLSVEGKTFHCADLTVLENRRDGSSRKTIRLHVAIVHGKAGGVPTVELIGGPGGGGEDLVGSLVAGRKAVAEVYAPLLAKGDLVVLDQRGVGRSVPRLACNFDVSGDPVARCRKSLEEQGIDLAAYDTAENADDVHDLRVALGVPKVDLHGISYGTRLGLEIMKRHPDDVRASVIDGIMPPDVPLVGSFSVALDDVVTRVFAACAADAKCAAAYPDLEGTLVALEEKLRRTPFRASDPQLGDYDYDWLAFKNELAERLYTSGTGALLPRWITRLRAQTQAEFTAARDAERRAAEAAFDAADAADADNPLVAELQWREEDLAGDDPEAFGMAMGMYLSVTCNDYGQHETPAAARDLQATLRPVLRDELEIEQGFADCAEWPTRASEPSTRAPSTFAGPVLVVGGAFDVATPLEWARIAAKTLPAGRLVEVPDGGHGFMDACGAALKGAFLTDPARPLDASCATDRAVPFVYEPAPQRSRTYAPLVAPAAPFAPTRPAATHLQRVAALAALAAQPAVLNQLHREVHRRR